MAEKLKYFVNGQYVESKTDKYYDLVNPSTGEVTGYAPNCTAEEVEEAIAAAKAAYPAWSATPAIKRAQIMYKVRDLLMEHMEELTQLAAEENGKVWSEAEGDVLKIMANSSAGSSYEEIEIKHEGDDLLVSLNNKYLIDAIRSCECERLRIEMTSVFSSINIIPLDLEEGSDEVFFLLPIKTKQ